MKSTVLIFRFLGLIVFGAAGFYLGNLIVSIIFFPTVVVLPYAIGATVILALIGFLITPAITLNPINWIRSYLSKVSGSTLVFALIGLVVGLIIAALVSLPMSFLPKPFSSILPFVAAVLFGYLGVAIAVSRQGDLREILPIGHRASKGTHGTSGKWQQDKSILIDTSVIIDGRIADIARTGFISGTLVIPRFVLNELQYIADSAESLRRQRGRRGMEVLSDLQKEKAITTTIADIDVEGVREVDEKLIMLARQMQAPILTNDYNLNRVAELQGVQVLNINDLANAVKSILLPGELLAVNVIQEGKEVGQGVGYLDDGTMVVVEEGRSFIGKEIAVSVTKVLQTAAGRMIFSKPEAKSGNGNGNNKK